jgi:hypothetical protein
MTATIEQVRGSTVSQTDREYRYSSTAVIPSAIRKNQTTDVAPSDMSPTILAKPMMWTVWFSFSNSVLMASSCPATSR